jgi:acyl transferase domain-containing protein
MIDNPEAGGGLSPLRQALLAIEKMQARVDEMERARTEPIAIVGIGCRFPGGAASPEEFWRLLHDGVDAIVEQPPERWDLAAHYDPDPEAVGKTYCRRGGFLQQVDLFDAEFFGISPRDAQSMDPQHRLLLEVAWEAIEDGCIAPDRLAGSATGVFVGITNNDYAEPLDLGGAACADAFHLTGNPLNFAAGRLSYVLGLRGPSLAVDTACSSSLVAIHLACQSLRAGDCDAALAAGVNLILSPRSSVVAARAHMLSPDGRCKTFAAAADGLGRGEGCGVLVLKRWRDAQRAGDPVRAVILGSAVNQDGRSGGLTIPSRQAQEEVLRQALAASGLQPAQLDGVEAHGTGTALGDPIEVSALAAVLGAGRDEPFWLGSVKTNIGHLESAAGVAGVIKMVLAMEHGEIPAHLHFAEPNPRIDWRQAGARIATSTRPWPLRGDRRTAGVSAFGGSGTNAHLILAQAAAGERPPATHERPLHLLALSARTAQALRDHADRVAAWLRRGGAPVADVCYAANTGRAHFEHRLAVAGATAEELAGGLRAFAAGAGAPGLATGRSRPDRRSRIAFVFTGQGAQHRRMGQRLFATQPQFRSALERCEDLLRPALERPLLEVLYPPGGVESPIDRTAYTQPALFAFEYALAQLWRSWGIEPAAVIGHSLGEYVAACVAGVFSLEDGLRLVTARGRLMEELPAGGAMAAVFAAADRVAAAIGEESEAVAIAAINGPAATVISGDAVAVAAVCEQLAREGTRYRPLDGAHAFHSPWVEPMLDAFERFAEGISYRPARLPVAANLTGRLAADTELGTAAYWRRQARQTVRFGDGLRALVEHGCDAFLEIGPHPTLAAAGRAAPEAKAPWFTSLRRGGDDWAELLGSLAGLYTQGHAVDWAGFDQGYPRRPVSLPTYPFQRRRHWPAVARREASAAGGVACSNRVLGRRLRLAGERQVFESRLSVEGMPFLADHRVYGRVVVPGACHCSTLLSAVEELFGAGPCHLAEVVFSRALVLEETGARVVQVVVQPESAAGAGFRIHALAGETAAGAGEWVQLAGGRLGPAAAVQAAVDAAAGAARGGPGPCAPLSEIRRRCAREVESGELYRLLWSLGLHLGPDFRWIDRWWIGEGEALCRMSAPPGRVGGRDGFLLHPGLIDSCFQLSIAPDFERLARGDLGSEVFAPFSLDALRWQRGAGSPLWCHAVRRGGGGETVVADLRLFDEQGVVAAEIDGLSIKRAPSEALLRGAPRGRDWTYELSWRLQGPAAAGAPGPPAPPAPAAQPGTWLILGGPPGIGNGLARDLAALGEQVVLVGRAMSREAPGDGRRQEDPAPADELESVLADALAPGSRPCRGIVDLRSLDAPVGADVEAALGIGCGGALQALQALTRVSPDGPARLWLVTRGAQAVEAGPSPPDAVPAALWGLGRVIAGERPELWGGLIDLDPAAADDDDCSALAAELLLATREREVALRGGRRYVPRLHRGAGAGAGADAGSRQVQVRGDAAYLVTGGLGAAGLAVARWLVDQGARHLVLTSRSGLPERPAWSLPAPGGDEEVRRRIAAVLELERLGAQVLVAVADVGQAADVAGLLDQLQRAAPPLRGVVHCAGVLDDGVLTQQTWSRLARVLSPKAVGAWNLHRLTLGLPLDFFVMFSSVASLLGSPGQAGYAAANAFLDGLAHRRADAGLPATSVNWGPWGDGGMAARLGERGERRWLQQGIELMAPAAALQALGQALRRGLTQVGVMSVDWRSYARQTASGDLPPLLAELAEPAAREPREHDGEGDGGNLARRLAAAPPGARRELLVAHVGEAAGKVLGLGSDQGIDPLQGWVDMGMDSLLAIELRNRLQGSLGRSLPSTLVFDYATLDALVEHLLQALPAAAPVEKSSAVGTGAGTAADDLEGLSDADVRALLDERLDLLDAAGAANGSNGTGTQSA